jgi:multidrug efflux pump
VQVSTTLDQSVNVADMVAQLEGSVLTAIALVMIVVLAALGTRSAMLVGFAIPTSFMLAFVLLGIMGVPISNIVMFGLILAVGMLVDGGVVVVEYADKRLEAGARPMQAYTDAAKRMFWPVVSSTATTLCAFLPMLFWPGVPGEFMGMLPVTMIFVLSASLIVALIYLPVLGGVAARFTRLTERGTAVLVQLVPWYGARLVMTIGVAYLMALAALQTINPGILISVPEDAPAMLRMAPGVALFVLGSVAMSVLLGSVMPKPRTRRIEAGYRRTLFGKFIHLVVGNPVMPVVTIAAVIGFVVGVFVYFGQNNNGVEFFVESEPENAIVYVRARGNLSVEEKDALVRQVEAIVLEGEGVRDVFAFAGDGGLNNNTGGAAAPSDTIGQVQLDLEPWGMREDGDLILERLQTRLDLLPGIQTEIFSQSRGPSGGKPLHLRLSGNNWAELQAAARMARAHFADLPGLTLIEDTLPLPGIDWQIDVDVEAAGRFGADVATVGAMVQLVTRGILLDTMRVPTSDEEIEIRVRFPEQARVLSTLDTLRVRTRDGLVPLSNFVTYTPAPQLAEINRIDQSRVLDVKADVIAGLYRIDDATGEPRAYLVDAAQSTAEGSADFTIDERGWKIFALLDGQDPEALAEGLRAGDLTAVPVNANERIAAVTAWLQSDPLPASVNWTWAGDQEEQAESQAFLGQAFGAALGLMFIILLAQFNSIYNSVLVLLAVVLSTAGVLIGMLVMGQTFSIIMTGTGIVALAGIVVNNNIVLIDTYQEFARYMPRLEAITRTVEARIRPVLLTTITTMAGLTPMMFGISLDFANGGYTVDSPTALWWKQLATAVVFGLGVATVLTLIFTPALLAFRIWFWTILMAVARGLGRLGAGEMSRRTQDWALTRQAKRAVNPTIFWDEDPRHDPAQAPVQTAPIEDALPTPPLRAAE